ncbi:MAG: hypothetical protein J6W22_13150 [Fibrobacter sp.]|nr:hypothetical protein [Fibrobacter sp.]
MPFIKKPITTEDKIKMFERMGSTAAVIALVLVVLIETGLAGENREAADTALTAMIVVLAVSLVGSMFFKRKK